MRSEVLLNDLWKNILEQWRSVHVHVHTIIVILAAGIDSLSEARGSALTFPYGRTKKLRCWENLAGGLKGFNMKFLSTPPATEISYLA